MKRLLIKQAMFIPVIYFVFIVFAGFFAIDYSHFGQHASELGINENKTAILLFQIGIIATSLSFILFAAGLKLCYTEILRITPVLLLMFGITFIFGAFFPIGSPWHGLYGVGMLIMLTPFVFVYEIKGVINNKPLYLISIIAGFLMFIYLWSMVARLDPIHYRGLTQRLFGIVVFGWISFSAYTINRNLKTSLS